jgi:hypothetical protein
MSFDMNSPNPYAASPSTPPNAPKKSNVLMYVLIGVGVTLLVGCSGCGGLMMWGGMNAMNLVASTLKPTLQSDPVIQEHIGDIQSLNMNFVATGQEGEKNKQPAGQERVVFDIKGSKGSGQVVGKVEPAGQQVKLGNGELRMSTGEKFPLTP